LSGVLFHDRDVSVGLISYHFPASHQAGQDRGFGSALCQEHETVTFIGLGAAPVCAVHCSSFRDEPLGATADFPYHSGHAIDEVSYPSVIIRRRLAWLVDFLIHDLTPASGGKWLWVRHVMSFPSEGGNRPPVLVLQIKNNQTAN
jgi:hypothetical protein